MAELLQKMLNEVVITPFDAAITERLATICDAMADEVTVKDIDRYVVPFVTNVPEMAFKNEVEGKYADDYPEEVALVLPPLFAIVLAQYIAVKVISEKLEGRDQATASLILMNYMLYRKGSLTRLMLPEYIRQMYFKMDAYINSQDTIALTGAFEHLAGLLADANYLDEHHVEDNVKAEVRRMAKQTHLYRLQGIVGQYKFRTDLQPYVRTYQFVKDLLKLTDWKVLKTDVVVLLKEVLTEEEQKKSATVDNVVNELRRAVAKVPYEQIEGSSLLLRYINGENVPTEIAARRLTVMEFGMYVYYEILLEHIISEYYDG